MVILLKKKNYPTWRTNQYLCKNLSSDHKFTGFDSDIHTESWKCYKVAPVYGTVLICKYKYKFSEYLEDIKYVHQALFQSSTSQVQVLW